MGKRNRKRLQRMVPRQVHAPKRRHPRNKRYRVIVGNGDLCSRCGMPTEIREHNEITEKHLRQPYYYSRWFCCVNPECRTTLIMPPRYIVWRDGELVTEQTTLPLLVEQLTPPPNWLDPPPPSGGYYSGDDPPWD